MWEHFTAPARRIVLSAQQTATEVQSPTIECEHILLALLSVEATIAARILADVGLHREPVPLQPASQQRAPQETAQPEDTPAHLRLSPPEINDLGVEFQVDAELVRRIEGQVLQKLRAQSTKPEPLLSNEVKLVLELAADEVRIMRRHFKEPHTLSPGVIGPEHLLLGLLRLKNMTAQLLSQAGLELKRVRKLVYEFKSLNDDAHLDFIDSEPQP